MIGHWLRRLGLIIRIGLYRVRLSRMYGRLNDLQTKVPATRPVVTNEIRRLRSLEEELFAVRDNKQLRYWRMRLEMATPYLRAPFAVARNMHPGTMPKRRRRSKSA